MNMQDIQAKVEPIAAKHQVRVFGWEETKNEFGERIVRVHPHINDFRFCDTDVMFDEIAKACDADVGYGGANFILIRTRPLTTDAGNP
jgi:hypothetical protein